MENNFLEQSKALQWIWKDNKIKLGDLHYNQLKSILISLNKNSNKKWFGIENNIWKTSIRQILKHKYPSKYRDILLQSKSIKTVEQIINKFNIKM